MPNPFKSRSLKSLLPYLFLAIAIIIAYKIISEFGFFVNSIGQFWSIITPFFYGFILAYIINIPCSAIQRALGKIKWKFISKRKELFGLIITLLIIVSLFVLILYLIVPAVYGSIILFINNFPTHYASALQFIDYINDLDFFGIYINVDEIMSLIQDRVQNFSTEDIVSSLSVLMVVPSALFTSFLALISSLYILIEKDKFKGIIYRILKALVPVGICGAITEYAGKLNHNFKQYIKVQTIDGLILGTIVTIELYILQSPYFLVLGIMLGVVNYIPYFGSIIGSAIAVIVIWFTQGFTMAAIAAVVLLITQQIDGNFIQPKLMGSSFSLSPFLIIVSITIGGALAGIFGMIVAIPIVAALKDMLKSIVVYYEKKKFGNIDEDSEATNSSG